MTDRAAGGSLRILQAFEPPEGGIQDHVKVLTRGLVRRGHEVHAVTAEDERLGGALREAGARVTTTSFVPELAAAAANARAARDLRRLLRRDRFDVIHLHGAKAGALGRLPAWLAGTPVVYSPHSFVYRFQGMRPRRWQRVRQALTWSIERGLAPMTDAIVCISADERAAALRDRIAPAERLHEIPYGIPVPDISRPDPELARLRGDGPLFGFLARLHEQKGLPTLLAALEALPAGSRPRMVIVGNGPLRDCVVTEIASRGLDEHVVLRSFDGNVGRYLTCFDAYVLPSLWEGLPIGVLEAMAVGLPVIATAVAGTPQAVLDGVTGVLVAPLDPVGLAAAILRLSGDPAQRSAMGMAGRVHYETSFTQDVMTDRVEALYRRLASPGKVGRGRRR